jgi:hypothetical protein
MLLDDIKLQELPDKLSKTVKTFVCDWHAAKYAIEKIAKKMNKIKKLSVTVILLNLNIGDRILLFAGLITTDDLINTVKELDTDLVIIPSVMLKPYHRIFLTAKLFLTLKKRPGKNSLFVKIFIQ